MNGPISRGLLARIRQYAQACPGEEVCGLLLGEAGRIVEAMPAANVAQDRRAAFELDPVVLFAAHRHARDGGPAVVGHYHSHPNGSILPSAEDAAQAVTGQFWLIVTLNACALYEAVEQGPVAGRFRQIDISGCTTGL